MGDDGQHRFLQCRVRSPQSDSSGSHLPWLQRRRESALASFAASGFPTQRQEEWKYTGVTAIEKSRFELAMPISNGVSAKQIAAWSLPDTHRLVFLNGRYQPRWSSVGALPGGVILSSLIEMLERDPEQLDSQLGGERNRLPLRLCRTKHGFHERRCLSPSGGWGCGR